MKAQWSKGAQWGAAAWLAWVAANSTVAACHGWSPLLAVAWVAALALVWTRWARPAVAVALIVQAATGLLRASSYGGEMKAAWALTFFMPMSLPLIPLLLGPPDRVRRTLALSALGRWREAARELSGFRWVAVAAGVVLLNRAGYEVLQGYEGGATLAVLLLGLAALAPTPRPSPVRA